MSWRSSRVHYGLDEPDPRAENPERLGPHERWSGYAWHAANLGIGLMAAAILGAIATAILDAAVGYRLPYVTGLLRALGIGAVAALASVVVIMHIGDALDRRAAWRDDALQDRLPLNHPLARPTDDRPDDPPDGRAPETPIHP